MLLDRSLFDELRTADPATGAKPIVRAHASPSGDIEIADEGAFTDIDTAEEYQQLLISDQTASSAADRGPLRGEC